MLPVIPGHGCSGPCVGLNHPHYSHLPEKGAMQKREINPTDWLQGFNINHGIEVTGGQRVLYLSGQTSNTADGAPMRVSLCQFISAARRGQEPRDAT